MSMVPLPNGLTEPETVSAALVEHGNPDTEATTKPEARVRIARYDQM